MPINQSINNQDRLTQYACIEHKINAQCKRQEILSTISQIGAGILIIGAYASILAMPPLSVVLAGAAVVIIAGTSLGLVFYNVGEIDETMQRLGPKRLLNIKLANQIFQDTQASISQTLLDIYRASLNEPIFLNQKSVDELKKVEPGKLIRIMKYCVELSESDTITERDKAHIRAFFNTFIKAIRNDDINENSSIHNSFYRKMVAHGYQPSQLFGGKWKIQQILSQDLENAGKDIEQADHNSLDAKTKDELILRRNYYRGILAGDLNGNRYKPIGGGVNGAVLFRHLESGLKTFDALLPNETVHRPFLGVFKPHPETVREFKGWLDATQWGERIKAIAGMDSHLNKKDPDNRVNNEIFAYKLFHIFEFDTYIGFPTTLKVINKNDAKHRPASFCNFIPGVDIVELHVKKVSKQKAKSNTLDEKRAYSDQELFIWQMSKIFDYLTGNMDGHEGNAFVKVNDKGEVVGAVNFDYDKAFAIDSPKNIGNQYKWANLIISKQNFIDATKDALVKMFRGDDAEEKIQAFLKTAREAAANKQNFTEAQEKLLRKRVEVLKKIITGEIEQLSELKSYK